MHRCKSVTHSLPPASAHSRTGARSPALLLVLLLVPTAASAQQQTPSPSSVTPERSGGSFGAGLLIGSINGASLKFWDGKSHGFQLRLGTSDTNLGAFSATYEHHFRPVTIRDATFSLPFYVGAGVRGMFGYTGKVEMEGGIEGVGGMSVLVPDLPVEIFFEVRPKIVVFTEYPTGTTPQFWGGFGIEGGLGAHYYF